MPWPGGIFAVTQRQSAHLPTARSGIRAPYLLDNHDSLPEDPVSREKRRLPTIPPNIDDKTPLNINLQITHKT
jgi:hypothetical protein